LVCVVADLTPGGRNLFCVIILHRIERKDKGQDSGSGALQRRVAVFVAFTHTKPRGARKTSKKWLHARSPRGGVFVVGWFRHDTIALNATTDDAQALSSIAEASPDAPVPEPATLELAKVCAR
jgi:hypothetical protein